MSPNGHQAAPSPEQQLEDQVHANYQQFATQLGALNTLLCAMPLAAMLGACKRHQSTSALLMPANISAEQATTQAKALRNDQRIIEAALNLQRTVLAVLRGA